LLTLPAGTVVAFSRIKASAAMLHRHGVILLLIAFHTSFGFAQCPEGFVQFHDMHSAQTA